MEQTWAPPAIHHSPSQTAITLMCFLYLNILPTAGGLKVLADVGPASFSRPPRVNYVGSANVTATAGETAQLLCSIHDLGDRAVPWIKGYVEALRPEQSRVVDVTVWECSLLQVSWIRQRDLHILTTDMFTYTSDARYQVSHTEGSSNWTLLVKCAKTHDSGVYECQINTVPKRSKTFYLQVVEAFATIQGAQQVYVKIHSTLQLTCVVNRLTATAELHWLHNGTQLSADRWVTETSTEYVTSRLAIHGARGHDSGAYTCAPAAATHAAVQVHVINGQHPAAMQHGVSGGQQVISHLTNVFLCFVVAACAG